jgi:hypothetical protein
MPKTLTPAMRVHLDEETTRLAAVWRITRKDGQQFFFTDHDRDIVFPIFDSWGRREGVKATDCLGSGGSSSKCSATWRVDAA